MIRKWFEKLEGKGLHGRGRVYFDEGSRSAIGAEWHIPDWRCGVSISAGQDDDPLAVSIRIPGLGSFWLHGTSSTTDRFAKWLISLTKSDMGFTWSGRRFDVSVHDYALWWDLWVDDMGWTSSRPKWRDGSWHPLGNNMRQGEAATLETREVLVPMPERAYRATATLESSMWGFTRLPRWTWKELRHVSIEMHKGEQVPIPGKGENSYDCGEDAVFSRSCAGRTIEDGIGTFVASVLGTRQRRAGSHWRPEKVEADE